MLPGVLFGVTHSPVGSGGPAVRSEMEPRAPGGCRALTSTSAVCPSPAVCPGKADRAGAVEARAPGRGPHPHRLLLRRQGHREARRVPADIQRLLRQVQQSSEGTARGSSAFSELSGFLPLLCPAWPCLWRKGASVASQHQEGLAPGALPGCSQDSGQALPSQPRAFPCWQA